MILRFYPKKDATIYEKFPERNTGLDAILDVSKVVEGTSSYNSRVLLDFDYPNIESTIQDTEYNIADFEWSLKLYTTEEQEVPLEYTLHCYAVSQSWSMGIGRFSNLPQTTEGVSWYYRDGKLQPITSWTTNSLAPNTTASFQTIPGGGTWYVEGATSQTFSYKIADLDLEVTDIMRKVIDGEFVFNGFIIKKSEADEASLMTFKSVKYFSKDTNTIYSPVLEAKYSDSDFTSNLNTINPLSEYNVVAVDLKSEYKESSTPIIRFSARPRYPEVTFSTSSAYLDRYILPRGTQYAIYSAQTDDAIINFSKYTTISDDDLGNYFALPLEGLQPERYYKILIKVPNKRFGSNIIDNNWVFKVSRNQ